MTAKAIFFAELRSIIHSHQADVTACFQSLDDVTLAWQPDPKEWSILLCFDHLNRAYAYCQPKIARALAAPATELKNKDATNIDSYNPSLLGRVYMSFAFNPRLRFPAPSVFIPSTSPERLVLERYLTNQHYLLDLLKRLDQVDLRTRIPIVKSIGFPLGDWLKILVSHDGLHIGQAHDVLTQYNYTI